MSGAPQVSSSKPQTARPTVGANLRRLSRLALVVLVAVCAAALQAQNAAAAVLPTASKISLEPENATNTVGEQHCVTATVRNGNDKVAGVQIVFQVTGANATVTPVTRVSDSKGQATFCYTGTKAGVDTITAFADNNRNLQLDSGEPLASAKKTYKPGPTKTVTLAPATATNTVGEKHCVTATAKDLYGNATSGVKLLFSVTGANTASGSAISDVNGQGQFCYTGSNAGTDTITVVADVNGNNVADATEPLGAATKVYKPKGPSSLTLAPAVATNTVGQQHCVTATATDAVGNPTGGINVVFSVTGANPQASTTKTTDASGQATFCYTGTRPGQDVITAFADTNKNGSQDLGEPLATATKTYVPGPPAKVVVTPPAAENTVGTQHCVNAAVTDAFSNPVADATVFFTVTGPNATSQTVKTDVNGNAVFCYTGTKSGGDTITAVVDASGNNQAEVGEPTGTATKLYHPGVPATVTISPATAVNNVGEQHCVTATATDQFGNPVGANHTILFTVTGSNPQPSTAKTTDAKGQATFCYTGTKAGEDVITATYDANGNGKADAGEPTGAATKTYKPGPPAKITLEPQTATNTAGQQHCVTATVTDRFGNPVPGASVQFSVTGANTASGTGVTNAGGQAQFCYTGTKAGTDTITATVTGTQLSATATKTYKAGPPALVQMNPATATNEAGQQHCVTATVTDQYGNQVGAGFPVIFSVTGANPQPAATKTTDASGQAQYCYTGTKAGTDTITAVVDTNGNGSADAGEPTGVATKVYLPGPPATLTLSPKTATNPVGEQHCVTATVTDQFGNPTPGITVYFSATGSVTTSGNKAVVGASGSEKTNGQGQARFCYTSELPGENVITAFADTNGNGVQDVGEPTDTATKTYLPPASTPGCEVKITNGGWFTAVNGDKATFGGNAKVDASGNLSGQEQYQDHGPTQPLNVHSIQILAVVCVDSVHAEIYGTATVDGAGSYYFRIKVTDLGEPGTADTYSILLSNGYYSGERTLQGGNVQIHKS